MAILFSSPANTSSTSGTAGQNKTVSKAFSTTSGSSFLLAYAYGTGGISGVTANYTVGSAQNFTLITSVNTGVITPALKMWAFKLLNPTAGAGTIYFNFQGGSSAYSGAYGAYMQVFGANTANATYIYNTNTISNTTGGTINESLTGNLGSKLMFSYYSNKDVDSYTNTALRLYQEYKGSAYRAIATGGAYNFNATGTGDKSLLISFAIDGIPDTGSQSQFLQMF